MPEKISRDICLIKYRKFPLWEVDEKTDEEFSFYPKIYSHYWLKLNYNSEKTLTKKLAEELVKFYEYLNINELIFFSAHNMKWISNFTLKRDDDKVLIDAVKYFKANNLTGNFKGAIKVGKSELREFLVHYFTLTRCDSEFFHNHFLNKNQEILGYIHYSGEVRFDTLSNNMSEKFLKEIKRTNFLDTSRDNANRI